MDFTSFTDIPEEFIKDFELDQIALNGDISVDTLRALDEEKGQELAVHILGNVEF